ncbi:hypothetical protein [Clostridium sp. 001]|uniref:hypothetical protein n=1 Tax=Clostridium sp. 001 TaxID=1970093 RepID=UPI001C2BB085|nr:hypothetical protein [Clostridium sp. 001]
MLVVFILITIAACVRFLSSTQDSNTFELTLNNTLLLLALIPPIVNIPLFTTVPLVRDKTNGTIENLLATPLNPKEIVKGKSFAIFLPGFIIAILSPLIVMIVVNFSLTISNYGFFYFPMTLLLSVFVITPMFCYELTKFTIQISMIKSPEAAIAPSYLIGFGLIIGIPICSTIGFINLASWSFSLIYLGVTFIMWILVWSFSLLLTKEKIILSNL